MQPDINERVRECIRGGHGVKWLDLTGLIVFLLWIPVHTARVWYESDGTLQTTAIMFGIVAFIWGLRQIGKTL